MIQLVGVEGESPFVIPSEHVIDSAMIQAAVALEVSENSGAELLLERADGVRGQIGGGEEDGMAVLIRSEDAVGDRGVEVGMFVQRRAGSV